MQTMSFQRAQAVIRFLVFLLSLATVVGALLAFVGVLNTFFCLILMGLMYLVLYGLRLLEWIGAKKKPLAERVDQGRKAARPLG